MEFDSNILQVPIEDIIPNRFQPRLAFENDSLEELCASIKEHGVIQPLVLRRMGDKYEIVAGERRYRASKMAGKTSVPAVISNLNDNESAQVAIVENVQRKDLTAIEEAKSYKALLDQGFMTQGQLAKRIGLSQSAIANKLRLLALTKEVQDALLEERISERHARSLLVVKNKEDQVKWLNKILNERLTVKMLDDLISEEYKGITPTKDVDVEEEKKESFDLPKFKKESSPIDFEPINIGSNSGEKFYNNLEVESANLKTEEEENPFAAFVEEIENLDFGIKDTNEVEDKIDDLINDLNSRYKISKSVQKGEDFDIYTIKVDKKEE